MVQEIKNHEHPEKNSGAETLKPPEVKSRETFIPYRRCDVVKMCLRDGKLNEEEKSRFQNFCSILTAYYHFRFLSSLERLKDYFFSTDPDSDSLHLEPLTKEAIEQKGEAFYHEFKKLVVEANFHPLSRDDLKQSFQDQSLVRLNVDVDLDAFDRYLCYYRGTREGTTSRRTFPFPEKEITYGMYERVVLLLKYKPWEYFEQKGLKRDKLHFTPGRTYIFYYKNVPKADLEILFPNVKISMTMKDKLLFLFPAIGIGLGTLIKISANLFLVIGFFLIMIGFTAYAEKMGITRDSLQTGFITLVASIASVIVVLGGFAIRQYLNYKNKWVKFLNDVIQILFFRNISMNSGVFQDLVDAAEEEECKEAILTYYHLLTAERNLTKPELDERIELWFQNKYGVTLDFDVDDALKKLEKLKCRMANPDHNGKSSEEINLISLDAKGRWQAQPLETALVLLDTIWDRIYQYHVCDPA